MLRTYHGVSSGSAQHLRGTAEVLEEPQGLAYKRIPVRTSRDGWVARGVTMKESTLGQPNNLEAPGKFLKNPRASGKKWKPV